MKKIALIIAAFLLPAAIFAGCSASGDEPEEKISIVCTIFPQYDWVRQIIGEKNLNRFDLTLLLDSGVDLHNYSPTVHDIAKIKTCDAFIYVGGHSDYWVEDALKDANPDIFTMNLVEFLGDNVIMTESSHNCGCGPECHCHKTPEECDCAETGAVFEECDEEHEEGELEADEHIWMSLRRAELICAEISDMLSEIDPDDAQTYRANADAYIARLSALDAEYQAVVDASDVKTLVFADRFPFRYMTADYGLTHYAAFQGCSAETEASFATVISLANRLNQLGLNSVMVTESADKTIAKTVISNTTDKNQQILVLDGIQSVTAADVENGVTYLSILESNLEVLKEALK